LIAKQKKKHTNHTRYFPLAIVLLLAFVLQGFFSSTAVLSAPALLPRQYSSLPVTLGFAGACALLYGSLLLVREARLAVRSTLQEVSFAQAAVFGGEPQKKVKHLDPGDRQ
jgi:hypothetical protein